LDTKTLILIYLGVALAGSVIPFLRVYFAHFHNLVNLVISVCMEGGKIHLYRDGSGQTTGGNTSPFKKALISYAGYTGALVAAIGLFYLVSRGHYDLVIYLFLGLIVLGLLLWVRNAFGVLWGLSAFVLLAMPVYFRYQPVVLPVNVNFDMVLVHMSFFLASVLFIQSIIGAVQVCRQSFMKRSNPKRNLALVQTKLVPAVALGIILFGQTVLAGVFALNFISLPFILDMELPNQLLAARDQISSVIGGTFK
jgi:Peptidase M50B-like